MSFDECVADLGRILDGNPFFVEVGAMDGIAHDALHKHIISNPDWTGVLVEPLPDMFKKLRNNYKDYPGYNLKMPPSLAKMAKPRLRAYQQKTSTRNAQTGLTVFPHLSRKSTSLAVMRT
jgi:hypothetical protein